MDAHPLHIRDDAVSRLSDHTQVFCRVSTKLSLSLTCMGIAKCTNIWDRASVRRRWVIKLVNRRGAYGGRKVRGGYGLDTSSFFFFETAIHFAQSADWVDSVTRCIAGDSGARQVVFVTNLARDERVASPLIDEVFIRLMQELPVLRMDLAGDRGDASGASGDRASWDPSPIATSATVYLLVHECREASPTLPSGGFIDAVAEMGSFDYHPKYLVLFVARVLSNGLEDLLQYTWTGKLLDLTILEWIEPGSSGTLKPQANAVGLPIVHRLNPFKNEFTKSDWASNRDRLFPDKVSNMWHYPLRIRAVDAEPFTVATYNEFDEPVFIGGPNILLIQFIAKTLNASVKYVTVNFPIVNRINAADAHHLLYNIGDAQQMDIASYLGSRPSTSGYNSLRTATLRIDEFCAVVPILPVQGKRDTGRFCLAVFVTLAIVAIFLIAVNLLRFSFSVWRPFNIVRALFGVSVSQQPRTNAEHIMFACLLAISAVYSSNIYTEITNVTWQTTGEVEFASFDDLDDSILTPLINPFNSEEKRQKKVE